MTRNSMSNTASGRPVDLTRGKRALLAVATLVANMVFSLPGTACPCSEIAEPAASDPDVNRAAGLAFTHTEQYRKDFEAAIAAAKAACLKHQGEPNVCVVSDIDETILDNRPYFESDADTEKWQHFGEWARSEKAQVLKPTADFLAWARSNGFAVFLITGRRDALRLPTIETLVKDQVSYDGLYMKGDDDHRRAEDVKTEWRQKLEDMGFKIIVSIGDQYSDLYGGHAEDCQKLPNKMYYIP